MSDVKTANPILVVAALAVVAALVFGVGPKIKQALEDENAVIVVVDFVPKTRSGVAEPGRQFPDYVTIEIEAGADRPPKEIVTKSPWTRIYHPKKTTKIIVTATQVYGKNLGVVINRGKDEVCSDRKTGPSQVHCVYTFKP